MYRFILLILLQFVAVPPAYTVHVTGIANVIDDDTLEIQGQRIWMHGIDAPESRQIFENPADQR
ncbi:thermonuclease family protein [Yoonia vestfoldensis]|jgi:endonuclease YncB( thermonuclease family)|uniref:thermonuclease family protein n=1 Tax=Yoonia vestfoldensis TaxID=245188 RepID=UPI000B398D64|nr:hypothetical protein [Yoonia vestfoldensis]